MLIVGILEQHKHCVFCGQVVLATWPPDPKGNLEAMYCHSPANTLPPDSCGHRYHATLALDHPAGRTKRPMNSGLLNESENVLVSRHPHVLP